MSTESVKAYLHTYGLDTAVQEFAVSSATVELAAQAIGCEPKQIAKTLSFDVNGDCVLVVAAGDAKIDNAKFKAVFHTKASMLSRDDAPARIGHAVGGVCPFAVNDGVRVFLDQSLRRFDSVYPAAGASNSVVKLTLAQLEEAAKPEAWIDVCKGWEV